MESGFATPASIRRATAMQSSKLKWVLDVEARPDAWIRATAHTGVFKFKLWWASVLSMEEPKNYTDASDVFLDISIETTSDFVIRQQKFDDYDICERFIFSFLRAAVSRQSLMDTLGIVNLIDDDDNDAKAKESQELRNLFMKACLFFELTPSKTPAKRIEQEIDCMLRQLTGLLHLCDEALLDPSLAATSMWSIVAPGYKYSKLICGYECIVSSFKLPDGTEAWRFSVQEATQRVVSAGVAHSKETALRRASFAARAADATVRKAVKP